MGMANPMLCGDPKYPDRGWTPGLECWEGFELVQSPAPTVSPTGKQSEQIPLLTGCGLSVQPGENATCLVRGDTTVHVCVHRDSHVLTPAAFPPQVNAHQEDHIQALQLSPQGFLVEDVIHLELLGLAAGQLALQLVDLQEALALRNEGLQGRKS